MTFVLTRHYSPPCLPGVPFLPQVALERTYCDGSSRGVVLGVDKVRMDPLLHHTFIQGDVSHKEILDRCFNVLGDRRADVVLSDMAPKLIGVKQDDHLASAETALFACDFVEQVRQVRQAVSRGHPALTRTYAT